VRRITAVVLLCLSVALTGPAFARPTPKPTPTPSPAPTTAPQVVGLPIIVVYPFGTSSDIQASNGAKAANLFVQVMNSAGGIDAIDAPPSVKPADYLSYARSVNADYYVTGYMTPLGMGVSLVEQVVSTSTGTMLFGQTAQVQNFADASSQAIAIHDGILAQIAGMKAAYQQSQASATSTPMPNNQANLTRGISDIAGLFKRKSKSSASHTVASNKPDKGIFVAHVYGPLPSTNLTSATSELYNALNNFYNVHMTNANGVNLATQADGICGSNRDNTIATGTLSAQTTHHTFGSSTQWTFNLAIYTCWGAKLAEQTATASSVKDAVASAVAAYAQAHPQNS
jgi:TolB-like protein